MKVRNGKIKRPKFIFSYLVSAVILLIIFSVVGLFYFMQYIYDYMDNLESVQHSVQEQVSNDIWGDEEFEGPVKVRVKAHLITHYLSTGQRFRYQSDDTGMVDATENAIVYYTESIENNGDIEVLELADKKFLEYFKTDEVTALKFCDRYADSLETVPYNYFICRELYVDVKHGKFIPVEIELMNDAYDCTGVKLHFAPENTEGYTYVKCDYDNPENSPLASGLAGGYEGVDADEDYELKQQSLNPPYEKYYATPWKPTPFTTVYKDELEQAIFEIVVVSLLIAFVPAIISYNIKLRRYQIFEYRRKVTDAMAHDLKTPMAAITAYAENLSNHIGTDKQEHYAGKIMETVSEMNGMVNSILEFSRSEDNGVKIKKEETDISQIIEKIISDNEVTINTRFLTVNYDRKSVTLKTDPEFFKQALANLIGNAVIHCEEGSAVDISCGKDRITIVNTACEKIEDAGKLKQAFVKGSSSRGNRGSGLGLAIADNDLALLGYKLELRTEADKFIAEVKL